MLACEDVDQALQLLFCHQLRSDQLVEVLFDPFETRGDRDKTLVMGVLMRLHDRLHFPEMRELFLSWQNSIFVIFAYVPAYVLHMSLGG
jgi:hypothetical protein